MLVPSTDRVIIKPLKDIQPKDNKQLIIAGQPIAGENLKIGQIVHAGDTSFKKDQYVYFSEYSAAAIYDLVPVIEGDKTMGEAMQEAYVIVAQDDVMAFEK